MSADVGEPSDEELVRRTRSGDEAASRALFARHGDTLRTRVRRRLPRALRRKVAESDVVQEAWLAAFLHLGEFEERGDGSFARWLGTVLDRKVLDEVRHYAGTGKRDVRREVPAASDIVRLAGASRDPSPSTVVNHAEERLAISRAIATLPDAQRIVLQLVHEERLTMERVAERMGRSLAAVRKLHARAVLRLSEQANGSDAEPPTG